MKQTLLVGFVLAVFSFVDYALAQQAQERAEAPLYQDGQFWQFKIDTTNYAYAVSHSALLLRLA